MTEPRHERQDTPSDPPLSRLYREHAQDEPSAAVDQRILAAARQAAAARPPSVRRTGWWQRWRLPLALATSVMLTVSLALLVERQPKDISGAPSRAIPPPDSAVQGAAQPATPAPAPAAKAENQPAAAGAASERREARDQGAMRGEMRAAPAASSAPPPAAAPLTESLTESLAKSRADRPRTPERWLDEIRTLRRAGKREEAERQLREFRLAHPDYALPEEFRE